MSTKPWYAWYPGDWRAKTGALTLAEKGAYHDLLDHYYATGRPLQNDLSRLCRVVGADPVTEITTVKAVIDEFFVLESDGLLHNKRADKELIRLRDFAEEQRRKGRLSAQARWGNRPKIEVIDDNRAVTEGVTETQPKSNQPQLQPQLQLQTTKTKEEREKPKLNGKHRKTSLPDYLERLEPSERLKRYCQEHNETQLKAHLVYFVGYAKANGKQYVDWDQAVINAIRCDWAGLRKAGL